MFKQKIKNIKKLFSKENKLENKLSARRLSNRRNTNGHKAF